jgi:hypothetical protein
VIARLKYSSFFVLMQLCRANSTVARLPHIVRGTSMLE